VHGTRDKWQHGSPARASLPRGRRRVPPAKAVGGGYGPNTLQPSINFGKGFGDLPETLKWLRPVAIAGAIAPEFPLNGRTKTLLFDPSSDESHFGYLHNPDIVHLGGRA
jgi:hypothetical protein